MINRDILIVQNCERMWIEMNRMEDFFNASKLSELMHKQKKSNNVCKYLCVVAAVVGLAAVVYCILRHMNPKLKCKCMDEFEDEFEDEMEDDFFEDDVEEEL